ncbi:hypothetical protein ACVIWV_010437 [Bradyrhizobium diazoefficiens]|uniref:DUF2130 domain-containing protein n=1 Tax=Bradyrhizobium diazoefficiens TaxID=1355477 RepID=UPI0005395658|nr:DUF2130 domain-containing protein [Bradyrhizobium diazoefficiens]MBR0867009.1 DUF2130 domain-containing protein [Bradyrhizobium diazoefficiens]MBR0891534.1 DUF2130 domain-containing protein [Bradyrhizobium diazoefficiens]MBR0923250.1 DUF2130 domain-containing protein [Bradyrhizobium diazoefficiens]BAP82081.1 uncharacterized protein NK6_a_179 [Bradyrhizobium diazoefficiens]
MTFNATVAGAAHEPILHCPNCNHEIRLTESLAAPLLAETRQRFQEQLASKDAEVARKSDELRQQREQLEKERETLDDQVKQRLAAERSQLVAIEAKKAREAASAELATKASENAELRQMLDANNAKLAEAQQAHAEVMRKQRALDDEKRGLDLTVEKRVQASVEQIHAKARQEADEAARLRVAEKDQTIESMTRTIEELKRKAEQGSQQSQGEVLELELEELLRGRFPTDTIEPVGKGELGADVVQQVNGQIGQPAGMILWETKRTKAWSDGWLAKLRDDQRRSGADIALIISHALPKHIEQFDLVDGVWVAHPRCALPVAVALRQGLIDVSSSRLVQQGQQTKMEQVYNYLTGTKFRQRVEAVVEKFNDMRDDLDKERKFMGRQWAKRETQILAVIDSTVGMVGDLEAIAGKAMPEIPSLDLPLLEDGIGTEREVG